MKRSAGPPAGDHPAMDLGGLEVLVDGGVDQDQVPLAPKALEEGAQVRERGALKACG